MSSELLGGAVDVLKGNLSGAWDIKHGYADAYTDLGIARKFGNAAAAYSLRDIGAMNGRVVKVRRDADNAERDFSAQSLKAAADWCNGLQDSTLPGDVATPAAAYSLREVKDGYSGDVVRVRRESDDVEVDVALDANKKVSTSSAISNVTESPDQGDTTATTLGDFLTEATPARNRTGGARYDTFTPDGVTEFTAITDNNAAGGFDITGSSGTAVEVSFDITLNSGSVAVKLRPEFESGGDVSNEENITTSGSKSFTLTSTADFKAMLFITASADFVVSNFSVNVPYNHTATVATWYDQSGNGNNATQGTAASQPNIAEGGSLLTAGVTFDGTDDHLDLTSTLGITSVASHFAVTNLAGILNNTLFDNRDSSTDGYSIRTNDTSNINFDWLTSDAEVANASGQAVYHFNKTSSQVQSGVNGGTLVTASESGSVSVAATPRIGARSFTSAFNFFNGPIQELIIYDSDQSANRFKIESNINNYYGIYTAAEDGFVNTWYDQSGNGNDATQATAANQPKIVSAGTLLNELDFDGTEDIALATGSFSLTQAYTTFSVSHTDDASTAQGVWSTASSVTGAFNAVSLFRNDDGFAVNSGTTITTAGTIDYVADRTYLQTNVVNGGSSSIFVDGATGVTGNAGSTNPSGILILGFYRAGGGNQNLDGGIKELIIYDSDQSANRTAIESNIANRYGITLS
jgi:hypothetical protein